MQQWAGGGEDGTATLDRGRLYRHWLCFGSNPWLCSRNESPDEAHFACLRHAAGVLTLLNLCPTLHIRALSLPYIYQQQ